MKLLKYLLALCVCLAIPASANDSSLYLSGSPRMMSMMSGHPSVAMQSERIFLRVEDEEVRADCHFTFVNFGRACTVRMGFPDDSWERGEADEVRSSFKGFKSYVDGRFVPTRLEGKRDGGTFWHVKSVTFGARGTRTSVRRVRDIYTAPLSGSLGHMSSNAGYTLHTGSSWNGPIGKSTVEVFFARPFLKKPLRAIEFGSLLKKGESSDLIHGRVESAVRSSGVVVYEGPGRPQVLAQVHGGHTLKRVRTRWKPTKKDDIELYFKMRHAP